MIICPYNSAKECHTRNCLDCDFYKTEINTKKNNLCAICGKEKAEVDSVDGAICLKCAKERIIPKERITPTVKISETKDKIADVLDGMKDLLLYKNQKYGDSALKPKQIFYKGDSTNSILIRLDDKLGRVMSNTEEKPRVNDIADIIGYCTLLLISMDVTAYDLAKFKD